MEPALDAPLGNNSSIFTPILWSPSTTPHRAAGRGGEVEGASASSRRRRVVWTDEMERTLLEALIQEVNEGRRAGSGFKKEGWKTACAAVTAVDDLAQSIQVSHCKSKYDNLKREWRIWADFTNQSGFSVNDGVVTGNPQAIETYLEAHPEARHFARTPMKYHDLVQVLFESVLATGEDDVLATGAEVRDIDSLISETEERQNTAQPAKRSSRKRARTSSASGAASGPRRRRPSERTGFERLVVSFEGLAYQMARHYETLLRSKPGVQEEAIISFHEHFGILPGHVKLAVLEAFRCEFTAKNFKLMPLGLKKVWTQRQIWRCRAERNEMRIDVQQVLNEIVWDEEGEIKKKVIGAI